MAEIERKILIGVTGPDSGGFAAWNFTRFALKLAGAEAVRITPLRPATGKNLDGLVIGGGWDISPELYGHSAHHRTTHVDHRRDTLELALLDELFHKKVPILGICRGSQLINVYLGGKLNQNIYDLNLKYAHKKTPLPNKTVIITPQTKLASILRTTRCLVNSIHHQAIDETGRELLVVARDRNHVVQAVEHLKHPFLIGVQWHPEYIPQSGMQRAIFTALVRAAKKLKREE